MTKKHAIVFYIIEILNMEIGIENLNKKIVINKT